MLVKRFCIFLCVYVVVGLLASSRVRAANGLCCSAADCQDLCGTDPSCKTECVGASSSCNVFPNPMDGVCKATNFIPNSCPNPPGYSAWSACGSDYCQSRYCIATFELQVQSCGGGTCGSASGDSSCGNAAWPGCSGWCPAGYSCIAGGSSPCKCHLVTTCADVITQDPQNPVVTRISPTAANVAWNPLANNANIYKRHLSVCDFGTPTNGCPVNQDVPATMTNMDVMNLIPGEMYVVKIAYSASSGNLDCSSSSITYYLSSCELKPDPKNIPTIGADWTKMTTQINRVRSIDDYYQINYSTANSNIVQIATNWTVRRLWPYYYTLVKGLKSGTTTVKNVVNIWVSGTKQWTPVCDYKATVNVGSAIVTSNGAWWQAVGL